MEKFFPVNLAPYQRWLDQLIEYATIDDEDLAVAEEQIKFEDATLFGKIPSMPSDLVVMISDLQKVYSILPDGLRKQIFKEKIGQIFPIATPSSIRIVDSSGADLTNACIPKTMLIRTEEAYCGIYPEPDYTGIRLKSTKYPFSADGHQIFESLVAENSIIYRVTSHFETLTVSEEGVFFQIPGAPVIKMTTREDGFTELSLRDLNGRIVYGALGRVDLKILPFPHFNFRFDEAFIDDDVFENVEIPSIYLYNWDAVPEAKLYEYAANIAVSQINAERATQPE